MCARVCPTETLCEHVCVRNTQQHQPVAIGQLQRYAVDTFFAQKSRPLFTRAPETGKRVAVIGAGPAELTVAHRLAQQGHTIEVFDERENQEGSTNTASRPTKPRTILHSATSTRCFPLVALRCIKANA